MHKTKRLLLLSLLSAGLLFSNISVNADETSAESAEAGENTEAPAEENTEENKEKPKEEWKKDESTGTWSCLKDGQPLKGWNKVEKKWYYFDGSGVMASNTKVGIYEVDKDGHPTNLPKEKGFVPEPHGVIYNSSGNITLKDGHEDAETVVSMIDDLYKQDKNGSQIDRDSIMQVRYLYNALPMAEKVHVQNETKLAEVENDNAVSYNYDAIYATETDSEVDDSIKQAKSYKFEIDERESTVTIITRFTSDIDMDGAGDIPEITLVSPEGVSQVLAQDTPQIRNDSINVSFTWTDNFMQMDIANAENGTWTILTTNECTFVSQEYAGSKQDINPIPPELTNSTPTDSVEIQESKDEGSSPIGSLIASAIAIIGFIILMVYLRKLPKEEKKEEVAPELSYEEQYELLKKELENLNDDYSDKAEAEEPDISSEPDEGFDSYSMDEIEESIEVYGLTDEETKNNDVWEEDEE